MWLIALGLPFIYLVVGPIGHFWFGLVLGICLGWLPGIILGVMFGLVLWLWSGGPKDA